MDGVQLPQSTSEGWKTDSTLEPRSRLEDGIPALEIQGLNH